MNADRSIKLGGRVMSHPVMQGRQMIKSEMTRARFIAIGIAITILCLLLYAWRGLGQSIEITAMMTLVVVCVGLFPFCLGFLIQMVFPKRLIPSYAAWALALVVVIAQVIISGKAPFRVMEQETISIMVSFIITGAFVNYGIRTSRALFEKSELKVK
jgi:hypothetical protein